MFALLLGLENALTMILSTSIVLQISRVYVLVMAV